MSEFIRKFISDGKNSFMGMRDTAMSLLPNDKTVLDGLYQDLKRGTDIIDDEQHLNMYLRCFGKMHKAKLDAAFKCMPNLSSILSEDIEIYDWGCGQGTATICLLDYLKSNVADYNIDSINLIEPSIPATQRARQVISCYNNTFPVSVINKLFDDLTEQDFCHSNNCKIHLFSNILDVEAFDLTQFTQLFQRSFNGKNYFICVGPYYFRNKRVDDFIAATAPDEMYGKLNRNCGEWQDNWSISLRVFFKQFSKVESIENIRKRIEESHKKDQFFAGYILDSTEEEYAKTDIANETEELFHSLSIFDVKSNVSLDNVINCDSKFAVLANIVSRGLPTKAPIAVEEIFADIFDVSEKPAKDAIIVYKSKHKIHKNDINEALHIIDPRFDTDNYNGDMLESSFEKDFVSRYLDSTESQYLIQILEPQRPLSSIVNIPDQRFSKDQRVDFAFEIPYGESKTGFIFELDGVPYHSNIFHKLRDERRDRMTSSNGYDTYRLEQLNDYTFLNNWEQEASLNKYLSIIKHNSQKTITGTWKETLQIVLSPLAIARVERMLLQALLTGALDINASNWNILVVERDVPCAAVAIENFKEAYNKMSALDGTNDILPEIHLCIVSTEEFKDSKLHLDNPVKTTIPEKKFDLCIDISMLLRDNIDALPLNAVAEIVYIIRSSHYKKRERTICSATNIEYPPFVKKDTAGSYVSIKERENLLTYFLQNIFRKPSFRSGQLPILSHSLSNKTTIGLLPTGGGKSLTYQLSSMLQPGVTIVVDPLVSLMMDQVRGLREIRIDASDCVNSGMGAKEKAQKLNQLQNGSLQFMLLSPERYMMENFRDSLIVMAEKNNIYFAYGVIDEVHCVSEWGHDFRPSYLHLGRNMINFMQTKSGRPLPIIGLTATASFDVLADVERELTLGGSLTIDSETVVRPENDSRPELTYRIVNVESNYDSLREEYNPYILKVQDDWALKDIVAESKRQKMYELLQEIPADIETLNVSDDNKACRIKDFMPSSFYKADVDEKYNNAGIVFCPLAHGTFGVKDYVSGTRTHMGISTGLISKCQDKLKVGTFVGGDSPSGDMESFIKNDLNMMVATKAFGMGVDKPNVRYTIHINHPSSIEGYVQEAGRGGRDKKYAISYVLYDSMEYIHLTVDKVNDLKKSLNIDLSWLENYRGKYVLRPDFIQFCRSNNCSGGVSNSLFEECRKKGYFENVDKNIDLWFHNNSFRGLYKEKTILLEMTDRILNVKPTYLQKIQGILSDETGNTDVLLKSDRNRNAIKILSQDDNKKQYGYIMLDSLSPRYKYVNFDHNTCKYISESLINILRNYDDHSVQALLRPLGETSNITEGIYAAMNKANEDGYVYVTVSWENQIQQDFEQFKQSIKDEIKNIANRQGWRNIDEVRYGRLRLENVSEFDNLIVEISKRSQDENWLRYHDHQDIYAGLKKLFCQKRDKDDTDKAIYRMCCVGLVEDVTIDYLAQTYELKVRRRTDAEFRQFMLDFFRKYYSLEQAIKKVDEIDQQRGRNYLDKCLGYLTAFVYDNLKKKRYRAIEDMRIACEDSITQREVQHNDEWLKEFIHLYFNSKYARQDYEVEGENYSLSQDTDTLSRDDFDVVLKYIGVIPKDNSGSEVDNVKHLYGATLLCLRAHTDNAALQLLLAYCIAFLGAGTNEILKNEAFNGYVGGFMSLYRKDGNNVWNYIDEFNNLLPQREDFIREKIIKEGKKTVMLFIHEDKFSHIANKYIGK